MTQIARPQHNSTSVVKRAAEEYFNLVWEWAVESGYMCEDSEDTHPEFFALLFHAMDQMPDSYECGRYLEDEHNWPTDGILIRILDRAYASLRYHQRREEYKWVVSTGVRFPANAGDKVSFRCDGKRDIGVVKDVIQRAAAAYVDVSVEVKKPRVVRVLAEDVLKVIDNKQRVPKLSIVTK